MIAKLRKAGAKTSSELNQEKASTGVNLDLYSALRDIKQKGDSSDGWSRVRQALTKGATAKYASASGETSLMILVTLDNVDEKIVQQIFERSNVNAQKKDGESALHLAVDRGSLPLIERLLKAGANVNAIYSDLMEGPETPLDTAIGNKRFWSTEKMAQVTTPLKNAGAKTNAELKAPTTTTSSVKPKPLAALPTTTPAATSSTRSPTATPTTPKSATFKADGASTTALLKLLQKSPFDAVAAETLFKSGADLKTADTNGKTPLILASESGAPEAVEWLIAKKVAVNEVDNRGMTALMYAAARSNDEIAWRVAAELLGASDINLKLKNKDGQTARDIAIDKSNSQTQMAIEIAAEL